MAGTPIIIHGEHGIETKNIEDNWKSYLGKKVLYYICDHLIGISKDIKDTLIRRYKIRSDKITVIYNGVIINNQNFKNNELKQKYHLESFPKVVGTVGRVKPVKDFITLIKAFEIVKKEYPDCALVIVGPENYETNPYYVQLKSFINKMNLHDIFFTGTVQNIPEILSIFDIFVNSSLSEGISNTILEAMANKIPVVASRVGGNPELIVHEKTGLLFESQNAAECADCITKILRDSVIRAKYIDSAHQHVIQNHTMESMYDKNITLYKELLYPLKNKYQ